MYLDSLCEDAVAGSGFAGCFTCEIPVLENPHVISDSPLEKFTCEKPILENPHVISDSPLEKFTCEIPVFGNPHVIPDSLPSRITCENPILENPHVIPDSLPSRFTCEILVFGKTEKSSVIVSVEAFTGTLSGIISLQLESKYSTMLWMEVWREYGTLF